MFVIAPGENTGSGLRRVLGEIITEMESLLHTLDHMPDPVVHEFRKNGKRVRAVLRLLRPAIGEEIYRRENLRFRDLSRGFSAARDAAVVDETLRSILPPAAPEASTVFAVGFPGDRSPAELLPDPESLDAILTGLQTAQTALEKAPFGSDGGEWVYRGLAATAKQARRGYGEAWRKPQTAQKFHEWRKQVKYLRYQFEVLAPAGSASNAVDVETLDHLAELLGRAHDAAFLESMLQGTGGEIAGFAVEMLERRTHRLRIDSETASRTHGRDLFKQPVETLLAWYPEG